MPKSRNRAHERQLARAREKRAMERASQRRRRFVTWTAGVVAALMVASLVGAGVFATRVPEQTPPAPPAPDPPATPLAEVACGAQRPAAADEPKPSWDEPPPTVIDPQATYLVTLETSCGEIVVELDSARSPRTANNFVFLAREGFYDGVTFHRVMAGFMIQGGDPTGTGMGGPGYRFEDELDAGEQDGYPRGTIAMANSGPDTQGSQFFIMHSDYPLPPEYSRFGRVVSGIETVDRIARIPTDTADAPLERVYIERVTVEEAAPPGDDGTDE